MFSQKPKLRELDSKYFKPNGRTNTSVILGAVYGSLSRVDDCLQTEERQRGSVLLYQIIIIMMKAG